MTLKSQIGNDLNSLPPETLAEAYQFITALKKNKAKKEKFAWKKYIGILTDSEAKRILKLVKHEFGKIEGEW